MPTASVRSATSGLCLHCDRQEAIVDLMTALEEASQLILANPTSCLPAPRPYPRLVQPGLIWIKSGRYRIAFITSEPPVIAAVFFETANILAGL